MRNSNNYFKIHNIYLILLCFAVLFMGVGYAAINSISLNVNGEMIALAQEGIFITDVNIDSENSVDSDLVNTKVNNAYQTMLNSNVYLSDINPDSTVVMEITIHNSTDESYEFAGVTYEVGNNTYSNENITFNLNGLEVKDKILPNDDLIFTITFSYKDKNKISDFGNSLLSYLNFKFDAFSPNRLYNTIILDAVADNTSSEFVSSSTGINFHSNSSNSNGKGLYILSSTINDKYPIYYYRGSVDDNNLKFAGYCWKIVRTTETGGIKIIYNGSPGVISDDCENISVNSQQLNMTPFNSNATSPADVGYMVGTRYTYGMQSITASSYVYGNSFSWNGSNYTLTDTINVMLFGDYLTQVAEKYHYTCLNTSGTCKEVYYVLNAEQGIYYIKLANGKDIAAAKEDMFSNATSSLLKSAFDDFYSDSSTGLGNYADKIEDTIYCNDRRTYSGGLHSKNSLASNISYFINYNKLSDSSYIPNLTCVNNDDNFTLKVSSGGTSGYGNNMLDYPIGTLTVDELMLAGMSGSANTSHYLNTSLYWWTLSPGAYQYYNAYNYVVGQSGELSFGLGLVTNTNVGIRPVVSLKNTVEITKGTGTLSDPYIVE